MKIEIKNKVITTGDVSDHVDVNAATDFNQYIHKPSRSDQKIHHLLPSTSANLSLDLRILQTI